MVYTIMASWENFLRLRSNWSYRSTGRCLGSYLYQDGSMARSLAL